MNYIKAQVNITLISFISVGKTLTRTAHVFCLNSAAHGSEYGHNKSYTAFILRCILFRSVAS